MRSFTAIIYAIFAVFAASAIAPSTSEAQALKPGGKHDTNQPIEINADSLEVQQDNNVAIFRGNVDVKQGEIRLQAKELRVKYRQGGDNGGDDGISGSIERIDANGDVFMSTPQETAKGDKGVYDLQSRQVTLTGKVVLTRGKNVIRGNKLVYNMINGHAQMKGGRVKGIFVPDRKSN